MTITVEARSDFRPARSLPNGALYHSLWGLLDFQVTGVGECYLRTEPGADGAALVIYDTGLGKTHIGMGLAALLFEDDQVDLVVLVCERNKLTDWCDDFERFTALGAHVYHGQGRARRLAKAGTPHVLCTTYETGRTDLVSWVKQPGKRSRGTKVDGPLVGALGLRTKRVLWIFDECTKLKGRSSQLHQVYAHILRELRKAPFHQRTVGLTATPYERDWEDSFNIARVLCPHRMPTVAEFEARFTQGVDRFGRYIFRRERMDEFVAMFQGLVMRKRKTDPDVVAQFPTKVERSVKVRMSPVQADFYATVEGLLDDPDGQLSEADEVRLFTALRMTAGHPAAHLHAGGPISRAIAETVGAEALRDIGSPKVEELVSRLKPLIKGQGAQAVLFTFFGRTVLPELARELRAAGFSVVEYHGGQSRHRNDQAKDAFTRGEAEIFLTSDAGSRGLNLGCASYVFEVESALTFANREQRINRIHRIDSAHAGVTCYTLVLEGSVEEYLINLVLRRNRDQDTLLGDEDDGSGWVSAAQRREMLHIAHKR